MARTVDSYRFLDFASRKVMEAWTSRERPAGPTPFTPLPRPLAECTVALVSSAGVALRSDRPFDQEGERKNPWWGDPSWRAIPRDATEADVAIHHLHIDRRFAEADLDCVLPLRRLAELAGEGLIGRIAASHVSFMGYQLDATALVTESAPAIARHLREQAVDVAVLVPA
jgi:D-proline reductase (dithiol) PrdB